MDFLIRNLLTLVFALPFVGAGAVALIPRHRTTEARVTSLAFSLVTALIALIVVVLLQNTSEFQFMQATRWVPQLGFAYRVGVDGTSALLVLMVTLLASAAFALSERTSNDTIFFSLILIAEGALIGSFIALDAFLFFVCAELLLIPFFFIIGFSGTDASRHAATTYAILSLIGAALFLIAIITIAHTAGGTFDILTWYAKVDTTRIHLWLFGAVSLSFLIRMAIVPFHTWLIDASTDAPFAGTAFIVATSAPLGAYGLYRFAIPLFPTAVAFLHTALLIVAVVSLVYTALNALVEDNARHLTAYASIASSSLLLIGLCAFNTNAIQGTALGMFNHGLTFGTLMLLVGIVTSRMGSSRMTEFSGLARSMPFAAVATLIAASAAAGLPLLAMFTSWFLIFLGSFQTSTLISAIAIAALLLIYAYTFRFMRRMFFGVTTLPTSSVADDLDTREVTTIVVLVALIVVIGVWPRPWFKVVGRSSDAFAALTKRGAIIRKASPIVAPAPQPEQAPLRRPPSETPRLRVDTETSDEGNAPIIEHEKVTLPPLPAGAGEDAF